MWLTRGLLVLPGYLRCNLLTLRETRTFWYCCAHRTNLVRARTSHGCPDNLSSTGPRGRAKLEGGMKSGHAGTGPHRPPLALEGIAWPRWATTSSQPVNPIVCPCWHPRCFHTWEAPVPSGFASCCAQDSPQQTDDPPGGGPHWSLFVTHFSQTRSLPALWKQNKNQKWN